MTTSTRSFRGVAGAGCRDGDDATCAEGGGGTLSTSADAMGRQPNTIVGTDSNSSSDSTNIASGSLHSSSSSCFSRLRLVPALAFPRALEALLVFVFAAPFSIT